MEREIKFRAWDIKRHLMIGTAYTENWGDNKDEWYADEAMMMLEGIEDISKDTRFKLMQYTGLKDKNGKEIYEGDVVVYVEDAIVETIEGYHRYEPEGYIGTVKFENASFYVEGEGFYSYGEQNFVWEQLEVIGNIYENPELLK